MDNPSSIWLTARYHYWTLLNGKLESVNSGRTPRLLRLSEVFAHVDQISELPELRTKNFQGDKGYITIRDAGFVLHAYFEKLHVRFEILSEKKDAKGRIVY